MIARMTAVFFGTVLVGTVVIGVSRGGAETGMSGRESTPVLLEGGKLDFSFPAGTRMVVDKPIVNGWRQTGLLPLPFDAARQTISQELTTRGFSRTHEASDCQPMVKCAVEEWRNAKGRKLLWMFWRKAEFETGFSWGEEK